MLRKPAPELPHIMNDGQLAARVPKLAETFIHPTATLRDVVVGLRCEILQNSAVEYSTLGDASYIGPNCMVGDAVIGKFCAIAASVRIGAGPLIAKGRASRQSIAVRIETIGRNSS